MKVSKAHAELLMVEGLLKEIDQLKNENSSLIKDVEKLREEKEDLKRLGYETYKDAVKYKTLTEHIKDKALNNPSEHRYFRLVHFIDDLEDK